jgi:hypothetical protein
MDISEALALIVSVIAMATAVSACWGYWLKYRSRLYSEHRYEKIIREKMNLLRDAVNLGYNEEQLHRLDEILDRIASQRELKSLIEDESEETADDAQSHEELDSMDIDQAMSVIKRKLEQQ